MTLAILITGGAGFIGTHLASKLLSYDVTIRILDSITPQVHGGVPKDLDWLNNTSIDFVRGSINDRFTIERAIEGIDIIVHLAAETGTGQSMYEVSKYNYVNTQGIAELLDAISSFGTHSVTKFILASSRSVYGEGAYECPYCNLNNQRIIPHSRSASQLGSQRWNPVCTSCGGDLKAIPTLETDPTRPASVYAATKCAQEDLVRIVCHALQINYTILRFQNVYGEGQSLKNPYTGILSIFSTRIRQGLELPIFEDGLESRDFIHVDDVARSIVSAIFSSSSVDNVINVGSGVGTSVLEIARELMNALGTKVPLHVTGEYRIGDIRHNIADISRFCTLLPGGAQITLSEGLNRFSSWVMLQPLPMDLLDLANDQLRKRRLMS